MKPNRIAVFLLIALLILFGIFQGLKLYLFADDVPLVPSLTQETGAQSVMLVFAHPDDESYTTGLLMDAEKEGIESALLTFTPGDAGEQQPQVCRQQFLGDIRKAEVLKSGFLLGVDYQKVFEFGDGTLSQLDIDTLINMVQSELIRFKPDLVVTFWPESGMTMHNDHRTIGKATQLAFQKYREISDSKNVQIAYTIMPGKVVSLLGHDAMNELQPKATFSVKASARVKTRLWKIHASQQQFVKNYTGLPTWLLYRLLNREYYYLNRQ